MTKDNIEFLNEDLKYLGFGENTLLNQQLEEQLTLQAPEFELYTEAFFDDYTKLEAKLHFKKPENNERYYFRKYDCLLRYTEEGDKEIAQTFFVFKGHGITFKEAFNLLSGRSVLKKDLVTKDGYSYTSWLKLDFKEKDKYGNYEVTHYRNVFDIEKALDNYRLRELLNEDSKLNLVRSLQRGNLQLVTVLKEKTTEKMYIQADPEKRVICFVPISAMRAGKGIEQETEARTEGYEGGTTESVMAETPAEGITEEDPPPARSSARKKSSK